MLKCACSLGNYHLLVEYWAGARPWVTTNAIARSTVVFCIEFADAQRPRLLLVPQVSSAVPDQRLSSAKGLHLRPTPEACPLRDIDSESKCRSAPGASDSELRRRLRNRAKPEGERCRRWLE